MIAWALLGLLVMADEGIKCAFDGLQIPLCKSLNSHILSFGLIDQEFSFEDFPSLTTTSIHHDKLLLKRLKLSLNFNRLKNLICIESF